MNNFFLLKSSTSLAELLKSYMQNRREIASESYLCILAILLCSFLLLFRFKLLEQNKEKVFFYFNIFNFNIFYCFCLQLFALKAKQKPSVILF